VSLQKKTLRHGMDLQETKLIAFRFSLLLRNKMHSSTAAQCSEKPARCGVCRVLSGYVVVVTKKIRDTRIVNTALDGSAEIRSSTRPSWHVARNPFIALMSEVIRSGKAPCSNLQQPCCQLS